MNPEYTTRPASLRSPFRRKAVTGKRVGEAGEFARLLLILADGERRDTGRMFGPAWWEKKGQRKRVLDQLHRCIAALNGGASNGE